MKILIPDNLIYGIHINKFYFNVDGQHIYYFLKDIDGYFTIDAYDKISCMVKQYIVSPDIDLKNNGHIVWLKECKIFFNFKHHSDYCRYKLKF